MNTYSAKITSLEAEKIKELYAASGAVFDVIQYSNWRAKTSSFQAIYYTSGKLLIQGGSIENIVSATENVIGVNNKKTELETFVSIEENHIGTDESGKGDFFGPLVIAGVLADNTNSQKFAAIGVKDSKKLDDKKILLLSNQIKANSVHTVVVISPKKYNELYLKFKNLNKLLAWGHARAIENILEKTNCNYALADKFGDESLIKNALMTKGKTIILKQTVRAEADIAVAVASILARAEFVKRINELENKYELNFSKGVSNQVIEQAKIFIKKYSFERLDEIAKIHFKTVNNLI